MVVCYILIPQFGESTGKEKVLNTMYRDLLYIYVQYTVVECSEAMLGKSDFGNTEVSGDEFYKNHTT